MLAASATRADGAEELIAEKLQQAARWPAACWLAACWPAGAALAGGAAGGDGRAVRRRWHGCQVEGRLVRYSERQSMDQQVVTVDQFTVAMASIQEALASLRREIGG
ncbi:hypothetical protein VitviT2T_024752 [Vitis vinifera]|uniref:Uncharacterized protein n=1 Tax=Vitis vinifera TaxID=29760 RepID=A0ABY9DIK3_VITVI|nr:hypothetical protein VitviT2T_024752 [Vitis vinifera]